MRYWLLLWLLAAGAVYADPASTDANADIGAEAGTGTGSEANDPVCQLDTELGPTLQAATPETLNTTLMRLFHCDLAADNSLAIERVRQLLDAGAGADYRDQQHGTLLHAALAGIDRPTSGAVHFYRDAARLLLARGADPLAADADGTTPLQLAAHEPDGQVTQLLLDLGAQPLAAADGQLPALTRAASARDNLDTFALLLRAADNAQPLADDALQQLAELAAARHDHGKLNLLLQRAPDLTLERTDATASLARALWQGAPREVAQRLADAGADPGALPVMGGGDLAWRLATLGREAELDWLLAQGFPLDQLPESGFPPLFYADTGATRLLLARGADPSLSSAQNGPTAAALTAPPAPFDDGGSVIRPDKLALLLAAGYPPDLRDPQGLTALEHAVREDAHWLSRALLDAGASALISSDGNASLLPLAVAHTRVTTVQLLLRAIDDATNRHPGLLLDAIARPSPDPLVLEALLVAGFATEQRNERGETALLLAAREQKWPLVSLLLRYGADPHSVNQAGCTLQCYEWSMPEPVYRKLAPLLGHEPPGWQPPTVDQRPAGFFALSLVPMLALWLLVSGWRLARHDSLAGPGGWMLAGAVSGVLTGGALFYQCQPCVISDPWLQMTTTGSVALLAFALLAWRQLRPAQPDADDTESARDKPANDDPAADTLPPTDDIDPDDTSSTEQDPDWPTLPDEQDAPRGFW